MTFAQALEELMKARGLSQAALSRRTGFYEANIGRWRRGGGIEIDNVRKLADFFGVDRTDLERLAGYGDSASTSANASDPPVDPQLSALLDAERAEAHAELAGIPPTFWPAILEARRLAGKAAARIARIATEGQRTNTPTTHTASRPGQGRRPSRGGTSGSESDPKSAMFSLSPA